MSICHWRAAKFNNRTLFVLFCLFVFRCRSRVHKTWHSGDLLLKEQQGAVFTGCFTLCTGKRSVRGKIVLLLLLLFVCFLNSVYGPSVVNLGIADQRNSNAGKPWYQTAANELGSCFVVCLTTIPIVSFLSFDHQTLAGKLFYPCFSSRIIVSHCV